MTESYFVASIFCAAFKPLTETLIFTFPAVCLARRMAMPNPGTYFF